MFTKEAKNQKSSHYIAPYFKALPPTANHNVNLTSQLEQLKKCIINNICITDPKSIRQHLKHAAPTCCQLD